MGARWTICSLLGNNSTMRLGYVSRANPASPRKHVLLKVDSFRTEKFAEQIGVNMANGWGIVKSMIVRLQKHGDGQYVLMKDPGEPMLKMYRLPEEGLAEGIEDDGTEMASLRPWLRAFSAAQPTCKHMFERSDFSPLSWRMSKAKLCFSS